jgi:ABC-2 type transport system permease protein
MKTFIALVKREILEHKNIWKVPAILIVIAILLKLSLSMGNLAVDYEVPKQLNLDELKNSLFDGAIAKTLGVMNFFVMVVMFLVSIFYALSCLYNERQDESVLFWRSLPISDSMTIASKLFVALLVIPVMILVSQAIISVIFLGTSSVQYIGTYFSESIPFLLILLSWSIIPAVAWCVFCSEVATKNPFLLAVVAPVIFMVVDKLFLNGIISQSLIVDRVVGLSKYGATPLAIGLIFSAVCIAAAIIKRSRRF